MVLVNSIINVDIGEKNWGLSDGNVLEKTELYSKLIPKDWNLPDNNETVNNLNYMFLGDEPFSMNGQFFKNIGNLNLEKGFSIPDCLKLENIFGNISSSFHIYVCYVSEMCLT